MRKKSHISLARYLIEKSSSQEFKKHRLAFYLGSILPDCKPSFLYRRHKMEETFDDVAREIIRLTEEEKAQKNRRAYYRNLGQITHYVADYFTFPHNTIYSGTLSDHCSYEEEQMYALKEYLTNGKADACQMPMFPFEDAAEIVSYIRQEHERYLQKSQNVLIDIQDIVRVNYQLLFGMIHLAAVCA